MTVKHSSNNNSKNNSSNTSNHNSSNASDSTDIGYAPSPGGQGFGLRVWESFQERSEVTTRIVVAGSEGPSEGGVMVWRFSRADSSIRIMKTLGGLGSRLQFATNFKKP